MAASNLVSSRKPAHRASYAVIAVLAILVTATAVTVVLLFQRQWIGSQVLVCSTQPSSPPLLLAPPASPWQPPRTIGTDVLVVGSSVARGFNAEPLDQGWAFLVGARLCELHRLSLVNEAVSGHTVERTRATLAALLERHRPTNVIIGLSTANEGLDREPNFERASASASAFERDLYELAETIFAYPTVRLVVLGGVYPGNFYAAHHARALRELNGRMLARGGPYPVIDFLSAMDNGYGQWRAGEWDDEGHPNIVGHRRMAEAVDASTLAAFEPPATRRRRSTR